MTRTFRRLLALAFLLPILAASPARAQLYNAGDPCPEPTAGRLFTQEGAAGPSLVCNGTTLEVDESVKTGPYARGIGTATPQATLDVNGGVRIGADTTCTAPKEGTIRYVAASDIYEFCNGTSWVPVGNIVGGATGQSMVAGWPDAIVCNVTDLNWGMTVFRAVHLPYAGDGLYYYRLIAPGSFLDIVFNADGTFNSYRNMTTTDCNVSIATLVSSGKAFNLANGAVGTAAQMSDGTAGAPGLYFLSDTNTGLYRPGNDTLAFATAGVESLRMTATGSVGIGTITPKAPLHVAGEAIIGATTGLACDADRKGGLRWSDAESTIEMCDGTDWKMLTASNNLAALIITPANSANMDVTSAGTPGYGSYVTFTVQNIGNVTSQTISTVLTNTANFEIGTNTCSGQTLAMNTTCTITIRPKAWGDGTYTGMLNIVANNNPVATLSGTATGACGTIGSDMGGGKLGACMPTYALIVMPAGCPDNTSDPACTGTIDTLKKNYGESGTTTNANSSTNGQDASGGNTQILMARVNTFGETYPAAQYCADMSYNGYTDWYLPAFNELQTICMNQAQIPGFLTTSCSGLSDCRTPYITSTETSPNNIYRVDFNNGSCSAFCGNGACGKVYAYTIRCVRRQ